MRANTTLSNTTNGALGDVEFLARSEHRVAALDALAERPGSRADLRAVERWSAEYRSGTES